MNIDLNTINWQSISAIVSALALAGAYIYPSFRDRWRVKIGCYIGKLDETKSQITLFINNRSIRDFEVESWIIEYKDDPNRALEIIYADTEDKILLTVKRNRKNMLEGEIETIGLKKIKTIYINEASGKTFQLKKKILYENIKNQS